MCAAYNARPINYHSLQTILEWYNFIAHTTLFIPMQIIKLNIFYTIYIYKMWHVLWTTYTSYLFIPNHLLCTKRKTSKALSASILWQTVVNLTMCINAFLQTTCCGGRLHAYNCQNGRANPSMFTFVVQFHNGSANTFKKQMHLPNVILHK